MSLRSIIRLTVLITFAFIWGHAPVRAQQTPPPLTPTDPPAQDCNVLLRSSIPTDGPMSLLQLSPNGAQLLLRVAHGLDVSNVDGTNQHLLVRITRSSVRSDNANIDTTPSIVSVAWSPDGQYVAYSTVQAFPPAPPQYLSKLYVIKAAGPNASDVVLEKDMPIPEAIRQPTPNPPYAISWSPDSQYVMFFLQTGLGQNDLDIISINSVSPTTLVQNVGLAHWMPHANEIAFVTNSIPSKLQVIDLNRKVLPTITFDLDQIFWWRWSPNSTQIALSASRDGKSGIFVAQADGTNLRYLVEGDQPVWSPDNQHITFVNSAPQQQGLYVIDLDGSNRHLLSRSFTNFAWSADAQHIIFSNDTANTSTVYSVSLMGFCPTNS